MTGIQRAIKSLLCNCTYVCT